MIIFWEERNKNMIKYLLIFFICLLTICCTNKKMDQLTDTIKNETSINKTDKIIHSSSQSELLETENNSEYENKIVAYTTLQGGKSVNEIRYSDINFQELPKEVNGLAFKEDSYVVCSDISIFCLTNMTDNNVNVRNYPSLDGKIIFQLHNNDIIQIIGSSSEKVNIDNFYGDWVNIIYQKRENEYINGWVFSKYINSKDREYIPIQVIETEPRIKISYVFKGNEIFSYPDYTDWKGYYIIVWGPFSNFYHYSNKPGIYLLDKKSLKLNHITYLGSFEYSAHKWTVFSDDFKYLIQDCGTVAGVRGITAWRWQDSELVFEGSYYGDPNINNNIIEIVQHCDEYYFKQGYTDEEIMIYGIKYKEENPIPQEIIDALKRYKRNIDHDIGLLIRCSFNLDTGERKILGGEYYIKE